MKNEQPAGIVKALWRYPVKSMSAEALESVTVSWHGLAGDRRWAFIRPDVERSGFPWLTIREKPDLWQHEPRFADPANVEGSKVLVKTPDGVEFDVADPELAARLGAGVRVIKQYSGVFDTFPLSLLTVASVEALSALVQSPLSVSRFRPNFVVGAAPGLGEFPEDAWVGKVLRIGNAFRCRVDKRDQRCVMVNVDPDGGDANPAVLRAIARERDACFGVYGTTVAPGEVKVGDAVVVEG